tara:strand:+ start:67 stop:267 length:201 start_codon:yes stop_codon:yes gene_type:complete
MFEVVVVVFLWQEPKATNIAKKARLSKLLKFPLRESEENFRLKPEVLVFESILTVKMFGFMLNNIN